MVDYTKPAMRDESWRRWKGGAQLAKELNAFYTAKRATDRIAAANPGWSAAPSANGQLGDKATKYRQMVVDDLIKRSQDRGSGNRRAMQRMFAAKAVAADELPGQVAPKR